MSAQTSEWIAVDWGTSRLRAWRMSDDAPVEARQSENGMGTLDRDGFEPTLLNLAGDWISAATTVVACGMVGSRQGWVEAPYRTVPCTPLSGGLVVAQSTRVGLTVKVIPGLRQDAPADVMRGEETQIAGFIAQNPNWDGVLCLPGTHTKWAHISAGEVVSFQTFMSGELFALIGGQSVLRHSISADGWNADEFTAAVSDAMSRPERLAAKLFSLRAEGLLTGLDGDAARARLSGLLIGSELAAARPYWLGQQVAILGAPKISGLYAEALAQQGLTATLTDSEANTLAGLYAAYQQGCPTS